MTDTDFSYFNRFVDLISVMDDEQLVRLAYRLRKRDMEETALALEQELKIREEDVKHN